MTGELTRRQRQVFDFICRYIERHSMPPTIREIGEEINVRSANGVMCHIHVLVKKGWLKKAHASGATKYLPALKPPGIPLVRLGDLSDGSIY